MLQLQTMVRWAQTYLDDGVAEYRRGYIADPHAQDHSNEHVGYQHCPWSSTCLAKDESCENFGDMKFGKSCRNGETPKKQHDYGGPHRCKDIFRGFGRGEPVVRLRIRADDLEYDNQERDQQGCNKERNDLQ